MGMRTDPPRSQVRRRPGRRPVREGVGTRFCPTYRRDPNLAFLDPRSTSRHMSDAKEPIALALPFDGFGTPSDGTIHDSHAVACVQCATYPRGNNQHRRGRTDGRWWGWCRRIPHPGSSGTMDGTRCVPWMEMHVNPMQA
eukprot:scaffold2848_cov352-Pavlova_lutheri.AAC.6